MLYTASDFLKIANLTKTNPPPKKRLFSPFFFTEACFYIHYKCVINPKPAMSRQTEGKKKNH